MKSNFIISTYPDKGNKEYPYHLTFSEQIKRILKRYCNYATFTFLFKTESELNESINYIKKEIIREYYDYKKLNLNSI